MHFIAEGEMMREKFNNLVKSIHTIWLCEKKYFLYSTYLLLIKVIYSILIVYIPAEIVGSLFIRQNIKQAFMLIGILLVSTLFNNILNRVIQDNLDVMSYKIEKVVKSKFGEAISKIRFNILEEAEQLNELDFIQKGISQGCEKSIVNDLFYMLQNILSIIILLQIMSNMSLVFLGLLILVSILQANQKARAEKKKYLFNESNTTMSRKMNYAIWGLTDARLGKEIRLFNLKAYIESKFHSERFRMYKVAWEQSKTLLKYGLVQNILYGITYIVIFGLTSFDLYRGAIDAKGFLLLTGGAISFRGIIDAFGTAIIDISLQHKYLKKIECIRSKIPQNRRKYIDTTQIEIEFKNVWYKYKNKEQFALKGVNLKIEDGDHVSIVGANGSGKTTLIKLMMGFYKPTAGNILINGVDMEEIANEQLAQLFSTVFQNYETTAFSVKDNIDLSGRSAMNDVYMKTILNQLGLDKLVNRLPGGIECSLSKKLDPEGTELSGGECQKIAIARAMYKNAPIMILDEPTASLSPRAENELYNHINTLKDDKTTVFISHRLASCKFAERIVVFNEGVISETGNHDTLIAEKGIYNRMFMAQAELYNNEV